MHLQKNVLHYYVDLLRINDGDHSVDERTELRVNALHNIIRTMKNARHNMICGEDFNNLDWGNIPFNGIYWSERGKNPCSFMKCNINEWNFMSGHTGEIVRLLFAADCIISGDVNGAIIIWNLNNGLMRFKYDIGPGSVEFLLCYRNALISISSAGKIVGLDLNTGHELYHFYVNSKILLCTLSNSHNCVIIHTSYYYTKSTRIGSRFIAFDAFSGKFLPNEIRTDDFEAVKLVTNNHGDTLAMSKKSVIAFNYLKSNTYQVVTTFPSESINSIHDIAVESDGEGGLITVEGAINASSMMWNEKNHQPKFIIYHSFTNPDGSYVKHPSIKVGWVDWGDEDGFGSDFDGEWCMRDKKGADWVCEEEDAFIDVLLSKCGNSYIIEKKLGYELYKSESQEKLCSFTYDDLKTLLSNQSNTIKNIQFDLQEIYSYPSLLIEILYDFTHIYANKVFIDCHNRNFILYDGVQLLANLSPSIVNEINRVELNPHSIIALSSNLNYAVTGDSIGNLSLYDTHNGARMLFIPGYHEFSAKKTYASQDCFFACYENVLFVWDSNMQLKYTHVFAEKMIYSSVLSYPNFCVIITENDKIYLWDIQDEKGNIYQLNNKITAFAIIMETNSIVFAMKDGNCVNLNLLNGAKVECEYPISFNERVIKEILPTTDGSVCIMHNGDLSVVCWDIIRNQMYKLPPHTDFIKGISVIGKKCSGNGVDFFDLTEYVSDESIKWEWITTEKETQTHNAFKRLYPIYDIHIENCNFNYSKCSPAVKQVLYQQHAVIENHGEKCRKLSDSELATLESYISNTIIKSVIDGTVDAANALRFSYTMIGSTFKECQTIELSSDDISRINECIANDDLNGIISILSSYIL